jgi:hypothetical protein
MTLAELQEQIVLAKDAGNSAGLTDKEVGQLEICIIGGDKRSFIPVDFKLEMAHLKGRKNKGYFVHYENKYKIFNQSGNG